MPLPEEAKRYFEEKLNADFVDDDGPFDYFEDHIYRLQMRQTNGNRELFYFYIISKKSDNISQKNVLRSVVTINTPDELATNLKIRIKNINDKHERIMASLKAEIRALEEKIKKLEAKKHNPSGVSRNTITFLISIIALFGIFSSVIYELLKNGNVITVLGEIKNPISIILYLFVIVLISFVFGGHLSKAIDAFKELFLNIRP